MILSSMCQPACVARSACCSTHCTVLFFVPSECARRLIVLLSAVCHYSCSTSNILPIVYQKGLQEAASLQQQSFKRSTVKCKEYNDNLYVQALGAEYNMDVRVLGITGSNQMVLSEHGIDLGQWEQQYSG